MNRTDGMTASRGKVVWRLTPSDAKQLAGNLERLVELDGERNIASCLTLAAHDLRTLAYLAPSAHHDGVGEVQ